jgi:hypothetical protein
MRESFPDNSNRALDDLLVIIEKTAHHLTDTAQQHVREQFMEPIQGQINHLFSTDFVDNWDRNQISDAEFVEALELNIPLYSKRFKYMLNKLVERDNPYDFIHVIIELCKPLGYIFYKVNNANVRPPFMTRKETAMNMYKMILESHLKYISSKLPAYAHDIKKILLYPGNDNGDNHTGFSSDLPPQSGPNGGNQLNIFGSDWQEVTHNTFKVDIINIPSRVLEM